MALSIASHDDLATECPGPRPEAAGAGTFLLSYYSRGFQKIGPNNSDR